MIHRLAIEMRASNSKPVEVEPGAVNEIGQPNLEAGIIRTARETPARKGLPRIDEDAVEEGDVLEQRPNLRRGPYSEDH